MRRKFEAGIADRTAHTVAALADARVGQADHRETGKPERDVDLDMDRVGLHTEHGCGPQAGEHAAAAAKVATRSLIVESTS